MTQADSQTQPAQGSRLRFSLSTMLLVVTIVCLAIALALTSRKLAEVQREVTAQQPLSVNEVARQFEKQTSISPLTVTVQDVRYSQSDNSYLVRYSWTDPTTRQTWRTEVKLMGDGYGKYYGTIRNRKFYEPLGYKDGFVVAVETPSAYKK